MIITITGKPCTGKSTMAEIFEKKYGFERIYAGAIFKDVAKRLGVDIVELTSSDKIIEVDYQVDSELKMVYERRKSDNIIIESRTAWSFMPEAFNVFIDVSDDVMAERLFNSTRELSSRGGSLNEAKEKVVSRFKNDVIRYKKIYNIDCANLSNYSLVVDNSKMTPEETADYIYSEYIKFVNK